jgi:hypothetical protein
MHCRTTAKLIASSLQSGKNRQHVLVLPVFLNSTSNIFVLKLFLLKFSCVSFKRLDGNSHENLFSSIR